MKKNLFKIFGFGLVLTSLIFVTACPNNTNPTTTDDDEDVTNNLSESSGTNEVSGKTYTSSTNNSKVVFEDSSLKIYETSSSASANRISRAATTETPISTYNYSYNSEDKTLELQLANLWDSNAAAITYKTQVETVKSTLENLESLIQAQFDTSTNSTYKTFIESLNKLDTTDSDYGNNVGILITQKLNSYITKQESILDDYLKKKYNSTVKFSYDNSDSKLALAQQFQNDLTDASSEFTSDTYNVVLNGYDSLKPFSITLTSGENSQEYVGVPSFTTTNGITTMSVDLYEFIGADIFADDFNASTLATTKATEFLTYVQSKLTAIQSDTTKMAALALEVAEGQTTTVESWIDDILSSLNLTATVTTDTTASSPKVTLTTTNDFSTQDGTYSLASGTEITLNYYPILSSSIQVSDLTLVE